MERPAFNYYQGGRELNSCQFRAGIERIVTDHRHALGHCIAAGQTAGGRDQTGTILIVEDTEAIVAECGIVFVHPVACQFGAAEERTITNSCNCSRQSYIGQSRAVSERILTNCNHVRANHNFFQLFTLIECIA